MKASELTSLINDFDSHYLYSDVNSSTKFGCDCGCGGDSYTSEEWDEMVQLSEQAYNAFKEYCAYNQIEWDYE